MKVYGDKENFRTQKVLIASKIANKTVELAGSTAPAAKFPLGIVPAFEDGNICLFGEDSISKYLVGTNSSYNPQNVEVDQWLSWGNEYLWSTVRNYVLPSVSVVKVDSSILAQAKKELLALLKVFNNILYTKTFLVGERLTLADVSVALNLLPAFQYILDTETRKGIVNVTRWFLTVVNNPAVKEVVGTVTLVEKTVEFDETMYKKFQTKCSLTKKDEKPKSEKKEKKTAKSEDELDAADAAIAAQPKFVDPFASMPVGTFVMDNFKRVYSNEDTATKAIPFLWENFDHDNYSIWYGEYKFPKELTLTFMSCNLISGMFQRLEKLKKHGFASVCLFGTDNNSTISGIWIWRGHKLAFELSPDWQVDYESYDWKKLDSKNETTKKIVNEYLLWEGNFDGKKFNQGKIFK